MSLRFFLLALSLLGFLTSPVLHGQTSAATATTSSTNAAPVAPAPPAAISVGEIIREADSTMARLADFNARLASDSGLKMRDDKLKELSEKIDSSQKSSEKLQLGNPSLDTLKKGQDGWQSLASSIATLNQALTQSSSQIAQQLTQLADMTARWTATKAALKEGAKTSPPPPASVSRVDEVLAAIAQTTKGTKELQGKIFEAQDQVSQQDQKIKAALENNANAQKLAVKALFVRNNPPLWEMAWSGSSIKGVEPAEGALLSQLQALRLYANLKATTFGVQFLIFIFLVMIFFRLRVSARERAKTDPAWEHTAQIFDAPVATATIIALFGSGLLYDDGPPRIFQAIMTAAILIPAVIILRRLIEPALFSILYAMVGFFFVDQWRYVVQESIFWSRTILLGELVVATVYLTWLIRSHRATVLKTPDSRFARVIVLYARVALVAFALAGFAEVLGYSQLASEVSKGMFESSYLAVILYAAALILDGLTKTALRVWPLTELASVRHHYALLCRNFSRLFRWLAVAGWLAITLELFSLRAPLWDYFYSLTFTTITDAKGLNPHVVLTVYFGKPLVFGLIVWASFLVSRFIRFILNEEVFTHFNLAPGVPYAASTMVHYGILLLGFFACINVVDAVSEFAILAGAFSVGLGFGLQNIMNNFVSGVILLFERPIKLGDVIQLGTDVGVVDRIGIRASVIRLDNGAEIIVPNGNLISSQVTNWTLSSRERIIEIPVTVSPKADITKVIDLLKQVAKENPRVMTSPGPEVLLLTFTTTALNFQLRVWTGSFDEWMKIRSELSLAINEALLRENIALS